MFSVPLAFDVTVYGLAPIYVQDMIVKYCPSRPLRSSSKMLLLSKSYNLKCHGFRSFSVAAPFLWNSLPLDVREATNVNIFKQSLKTFLFKQFYNI